jgi:hypothetical protein
MSVKDLTKKYSKMENAEKERLAKEEEMKNAGEGEPGIDIEDCKNDEDEEGTEKSGEKDVGDRGGDKHLENEDDEEKPKKGMKNDKEDMSYQNALKIVNREKARRLANADRAAAEAQAQGDDVAVVDMTYDKVARGVARYGSK